VATSFTSVLALVEQAKEHLVTAVPSPRGVASRPLAEALLAFEERLREARQALPVREAATDVIWNRCSTAIDESLRLAEKLRLEAPPLDYEGLVNVLAELISPLEAFADAERLLSGR
jgi:hypothetical protein